MPPRQAPPCRASPCSACATACKNAANKSKSCSTVFKWSVKPLCSWPSALSCAPPNLGVKRRSCLLVCNTMYKRGLARWPACRQSPCGAVCLFALPNSSPAQGNSSNWCGKPLMRPSSLSKWLPTTRQPNCQRCQCGPMKFACCAASRLRLLPPVPQPQVLRRQHPPKLRPAARQHCPHHPRPMQPAKCWSTRPRPSMQESPSSSQPAVNCKKPYANCASSGRRSTRHMPPTPRCGSPLTKRVTLPTSELKHGCNKCASKARRPASSA